MSAEEDKEKPTEQGTETVPAAAVPDVSVEESADGGKRTQVPEISDVEDWGAVTVTGRCCGVMSCRVLAPEVFLEAKAGDQTDVFTVIGRDIKSEDEYNQVRRAVTACPMSAIQFTRRPKHAKAWGSVNRDYPLLIEDDVYLLGYFSLKTAGAVTYLIKRANGRNIMIDAPRPDKDLIDKLKAMGGVSHIIFTHKDHTAFHKEWREALGAVRVLHAADVIQDQQANDFFPRTTNFEVIVAGTKPQSLEPGDEDVKLIPVPGHTPGCIAVVYKDKFLFTGDSLRWSETQGHLTAMRLQCWSDWRQQQRSLEVLARHKWVWVLPGHGDTKRFKTVEEAHASLHQCIEWMAEQPGGHTPLLRFVAWVQLRTKHHSSPLFRRLIDNVVLPYPARRYIPRYSWLRAWHVWLARVAALLLLFFLSRRGVAVLRLLRGKARRNVAY